MLDIAFHSVTAERYARQGELPFQLVHQILAAAIGKTEITDCDIKLVCFRERARLGDRFSIRDGMTTLGEELGERFAG
ncbi:MAG: hypothetical protein WBV90_19735 [Terrimicrobiaceae bacterium]